MNDQVKNHLSAHDDVLKKVIGNISYPVIISTGNVFHDLLSCIIEQQIHYRSSKGQFAGLLKTAFLNTLTIDNFAEFEERALARSKLSGRKYETIMTVLEFFQHQQYDWPDLDDVEVRSILSGIKGIGPWTVDMILLYTLERPDIFPVQDYHLKQIMAKLYDIDSTQNISSEMQQIAEMWSPSRSYAVKYLLASKEAGKTKVGRP